MTALGPIPEPEVIVRKVRARPHGGGHGGAWKVAYADFVTAMMAFFLLMWLLGATDEQKKKGIADYFTPGAMQTDRSGGSNGVLGGRSIEQPDGFDPHPTRSSIEPQFDNSNPSNVRDRRFREVEEEIRERIRRDPGLNALEGQLHFVETPEGLRIELVDQANYSMFATGTATMDPRARQLLGVVADTVKDLPNKLSIRGHTDSLPYAAAAGANNWTLSVDRAEVTRRELAKGGVAEGRFARLEGVADTDPLIPDEPLDPRNRRMSVTLLRG